MRSDVEDDLVRTLHAAAAGAPVPAPSFPDGVARVRRRRRRSRMAVAASALATALVAAGFGFVALPGRTTVAADPARTTVNLTAARSYLAVWPEAVVSLPARLPDGRDYTVEAALGGDSYVGVPLIDSGRTSPVLINGSTGAVRELAGKVGQGTFDSLGIGEHLIVWVETAENAGGEHQEVWSRPRDGSGKPKMWWDFPSGATYATEAGGAVYTYSDPEDYPGKDITRMTPGDQKTQAPVSLDDAKGWRLDTGTWAVQLGGTDLTEPQTYWNVVTGERRTSQTLTGVQRIDCSPQVCFGILGGDLVTYDINGADLQRSTGVRATDDQEWSAAFDTTGRFVQTRSLASGSTPGMVFLWDRKTGQVARQEEDKSAIIANDVIELDEKNGRKNVVDLTRIP